MISLHDQSNFKILTVMQEGRMYFYPSGAKHFTDGSYRIN